MWSLQIRKLRTRITLSFALVLIAGQGIGYLLVDAANGRTARAQLDQELVAGERVFERLLTHTRNQLAQAASVLAADYGFREAIATRDADTLNSVLDNHGQRIDAAAMQLFGLDGALIAQSGSQPSRAPYDGSENNGRANFKLTGLLDQAGHRGFASAIVDGSAVPMQIVVVPVRAPLLIAWIAVGFVIDDRFAADLRRLTDLEVSFVRRADARWSVFASTLADDRRRSLDSGFEEVSPLPGGRLIELAGSKFGSRIVKLDRDGGPTGDAGAGSASADGVLAVLQRSLDDKLAGYAPLRRFLLILALSGITVSILFSAWLAGGITRPLRTLHEAAMRLRRGEYEAPIRIEQADEIGALAESFNNMRTEIGSREQRILQLAYHDPLTGLPNRTRFNQRVAEAIVAATSGQPFSFTVLMMDLDRFRLINDSLGHDAGDHVLNQIALRLRQIAPAGATIARLGADEFAMLLPVPSDARRTAQVLLELLKQPILLDGQPLDVGGSIGIARFPDHGPDAGTLIRHADMAMQGAKRSIQGFAFYDPTFDIAQKAHLSLLGELRRAVESDELRVYFQPKVEIASSSVKGVEALVRWQHPTRGLLPPAVFMPYAEQTGFVRHVTGWMLERSIRQCGQWSRQGLELQVSVNVSTRDLLDESLPAMVGRILASHGVAASRICLEITESSFMEDPERAMRTLRELDSLGVELSIDDFGTGFSSLAYLKKLPVDELKIDRDFIKLMVEDAGDFTIVRSTIDLAHNLGLRVVAEGVENAAVFDALAGIGCDVAQGYFLSKPVPADSLVDWIARSRWSTDAGQSLPVSSDNAVSCSQTSAIDS